MRPSVRLSRTRFPHRRRAPWRRLGLGVALGALLFGCSGDLAAPKPAPDPSQLYWALALNYHAMNLSTAAPYDTAQLVATPRTLSGATLSNAGAVVYTSSDHSTLQVSPDGLVRAIAPGTGATVVATL